MEFFGALKRRSLISFIFSTLDAIEEHTVNKNNKNCKIWPALKPYKYTKKVTFLLNHQLEVDSL
jgi:hypothetical protein